jgi:hypothetical protein
MSRDLFASLVVLLAEVVGGVVWILWASRKPRPDRDAAEVDVVAQAIADCYGHGPLRVMDQLYRDEFRRDARAAIDAMRRRGSS